MWARDGVSELAEWGQPGEVMAFGFEVGLINFLTIDIDMGKDRREG